MVDSNFIDKVIKKIITIFLRPKDHTLIDVKASTWKMCLLKMVEKLKTHP